MPDHRDFAAIVQRRGFAAIQKIGEGSFGVAVLVEDQDANKAVCKLVDVSRASAKDVRDAKREGRLLARLEHPYIVRYIDSFSDRGWLGILMEFADGGDLTEEIEKAFSPIAEHLVVRWFSQAMLALQYLHGRHVLHRDLKPSNLFLTTKGDLRMGDFGVSKTLACTAEMAHTLIGTPYYISPEVCRERPYSWPSDIWAMGCILYHMCALRVPFDAKDMVTLVQKITKNRAPDMPAAYSEPLRTLGARMMTKSASARPSAEEVVATAVVQAMAGRLQEETVAAAKTSEDNQHDAAPGRARYVVMERFRVFDANGDGVIDAEEFANLLRHLDAEVWTDERIDHMLRLADTNGDGRIQFDEFVHWIFGDDEGIGLVGRAKQMIELAYKAADHGDLVLLGRSLTRWRQAIDIGYLRAMPPDAAKEVCETLAWLGLRTGGLFESAENTGVAYNAAKQMGAILHAVEQLLVEHQQPAVRRVAAVASRSAVRGLCLEMADGTRFGECPNGLWDGGLAAADARWEVLDEGEHIVEVKGLGALALRQAPPAAAKAKARGAARRAAPSPGPSRGRSPSPAPALPGGAADECLAAGAVLCTNRGRHIQCGRGAVGEGVPFSFKAELGSEVVEVLFNSQTCVGIRTTPRTVDWPQEKVEEVHSAFRLAAESVCNALLVASWKTGLHHGKYAQLQARRMGVKAKDMFVPDEVRQLQRRRSLDIEPPRHWDAPAIDPPSGTPGATASAPDEAPGGGAGARLSELSAREVQALQDLFNATHIRRSSRLSKAMVPSGMKVIRAARLQSPQAWANFVARREAIRTELQAVRSSGLPFVTSDRLTDHHLAGLAAASSNLAKSLLGVQAEGVRAEGDAEVNCSWLFHGLSSSSAEAILQPDFAIDRTPTGRLYGHGIYFTESCGQADVLTLGAGSDDCVRCLLLCRCVLGNSLVDEEVLPDVVSLVGQCVAGAYHSVVGDRRKRCPDSFREFVVYDADQVYPEILIWYRRAYELS